MRILFTGTNVGVIYIGKITIYINIDIVEVDITII
jgi:hypothetical protein